MTAAARCRMRKRIWAFFLQKCYEHYEKCVKDAERLNTVTAAAGNAPEYSAECTIAHMERVAAAMELHREFEKKYIPCAIAAAEKDPGRAVQPFAWI